MKKFLYIKLISFFFVVIGFSYCMTSFYNFYNYIFGVVKIANSNIVVMSIGLLLPLYMFIFGVIFYFFGNKIKKNTSIYVITSFILMLLVGIIVLILKNDLIYKNFFFISQLVEFLHTSIGYVLIILDFIAIIGYFKYLYRKD